ncbi:hypothetical protein GQ53DRAFT_762205 [Thozetella sp. PMI_491]|nr:hypothetical protein GQ53DRAFT_762205 [Thozetella sp. PMI_491]
MSRSSFGDPNAQPPTPKQTPTSTVFPSPVFQTPKSNQGQFDESSGWTPRFAEEYSVFNATPGNLRGSQGPFADFGGAITTPYQPLSGQKRPFSAEGIAAEIATHVTHFSPNPNLPLPPVDPSRRLPSSPGLVTPTFDTSAVGEQSSSQERSSKKARLSKSGSDLPAQTVTPPPSSRKGGRKLAPKPDDDDTMQNDQGFGQPHFGGTPQQPTINTFVGTPSDMFDYPISAPATAPAFTNQRVFWDADPNMHAMDIDFSGGDVFQTPTSAHRPMGSLDWGRTNQIFQETGVVPEQNQENLSVSKDERAIAPKPLMPALDTSGAEQAMFTGAYPTPINDPFGIVGGGGGVNPGLLFTQPPSSSIQTAPFNPIQVPSSSAPAAPLGSTVKGEQPILPKPPARQELRRSASVKELGPSKRADRALASSPIKSTRPGLSRSFSENRGKKPSNRAALPVLPSSGKHSMQAVANGGLPSGRPIVSQPNRPNGRLSPLKSQQHHRLSSLSSIPESNSGPRTRTQAKFTIDANGRARVETTVVVETEPQPPSTLRKRHSAQSIVRGRGWRESSEDDDESSSDDEPIIIPSRNASFVLPDPIKPTRPHPFHNSQRSMSERSTTSFATFTGLSQDDDSEAETVTNETTPNGKAGDAASELRKLRESRHRQASASKQRRFTAGLGLNVGYGSHRASHSAVSPTTLTDGSLPTPSTGSRGPAVRCLCNRSEVDHDGDGFMVQCESCEMWLHGRCVNISRRTVPSVYICRFCANTPNMRGGRVRDNGRIAGSAMAPPGATSPLAHKSFKSFR